MIMKKTFYLLVVIMVMGFAMPSCEKSVSDDYPIMESFYRESVALPLVSIDSIKSFSSKVDEYVAINPKAKQHRRYSMIKANIKTASVRFSIELDTAWAGVDTFNF